MLYQQSESSMKLCKKMKQPWFLNVQRKLRKKTNSSSAPPPPIKKLFELRIRKNMRSPPPQPSLLTPQAGIAYFIVSISISISLSVVRTSHPLKIAAWEKCS